MVIGVYSCVVAVAVCSQVVLGVVAVCVLQCCCCCCVVGVFCGVGVLFVLSLVVFSVV